MHVSLTNIDYSSNKNNIEIAVKIYTQDIELAIAHNYEVLLNLNKINELKDYKKHIENYFYHVLQVFVNENTKLALSLNHKETDDESTWLYFDLPFKGTITALTIKNAIFLDIFMDQTNMTILSDNGKESGYKLDFNKRELNYIPQSFPNLNK